MTLTQLDRRTFLFTVAALLTTGRNAESHNGIVHITIKNLAFVPDTVTVRRGESVEWTNQDPMAHTATVKDGWEVVIPPGERASRTVTDGTDIEYYCRFHPNMKGHIEII